MKARFVVLFLCLVVLFGMSRIHAAERLVEFSWSHLVPPDIAKYTIYELADNGDKTGVTYEKPYEFEGVEQMDFTHLVTIEIPAGVNVHKCYTLTASDISGNESAECGPACGVLFVPDDEAPHACTNFKFK